MIITALALQDPPHPSLHLLSLNTLYTLVFDNSKNRQCLVELGAVNKLSARMSGWGEMEKKTAETLKKILSRKNSTSPKMKRSGKLRLT